MKAFVLTAIIALAVAGCAPAQTGPASTASAAPQATTAAPQSPEPWTGGRERARQYNNANGG
jgi:hypothetical protein